MPRTADAARWYDAAWAERGRAWHRAAAARSRSSISARLGRLRQRAFFLVQCAISGALAYYIAEAIGHDQPFFAPIATLITLGQSYGQRLERGVEIVMGVAVGVFVGDVFVHLAGSGFWQMAVVILVAMAVATLLDSGVLLAAQAATNAAFVTIIVPPPGQTISRWTDAVIGGGVALLAATVTPASPLRMPRIHASGVVAELSEILAEAARCLRERDPELAEEAMARARASESMLDDLREVVDDGMSVVRTSPFRRGHLPAIQVITDLLEPLDRATRNARVLVRRAGVALRTGEAVPLAYIRLIESLSEVTAQMAGTLAIRELPESSRTGLVAIADLTTYVDDRPSLSSEVIRGQVRSIIVDLLMVTGLTYDEACDAVPETFELIDGHEEDHDTEDDEQLPPEKRA